MVTENPVPTPPSDRDRNLLARLLYMILFAFVFWLSTIALALSAILQFLVVAFTRERNENILRVGEGLALYCAQMIRFLTFLSDEPPFPFGQWPGETQGPEQSNDRDPAQGGE